MIQWLVAGGVVFVAFAVLAALVSEVCGINGRLDAADEEDRLGLQRIDQRRD